MTPAEIELARRMKRQFLQSFLVVVLVVAGGKLLAMRPNMGAVLVWLGYLSTACFLGYEFCTWRFARSIRMGIPMTVFQLILNVFIAIIPVVVLIRVYSQRTGIPINFWMREKAT